MSLKRPYDDVKIEGISRKKRTTDNSRGNFDSLGADDSSAAAAASGELGFPTYGQIQPMMLDPLQDVQANYQPLDAGAENEFIDFSELQDEQLLSSAIENNPGMYTWTIEFSHDCADTE